LGSSSLSFKLSLSIFRKSAISILASVNEISKLLTASHELSTLGMSGCFLYAATAAKARIFEGDRR
jgi:hypothetical protein